MADSAVITTPPCMVCSQTSTLIITIEEWQRLSAIDDNGRPRYLIQDALPERDSDFRELVMTGTHPECWSQIFPEGDDE